MVCQITKKSSAITAVLVLKSSKYVRKKVFSFRPLHIHKQTNTDMNRIRISKIHIKSLFYKAKKARMAPKSAGWKPITTDDAAPVN